MQRGKKLQDYIGKNEKTKLVVKIQKVRAVSADLESVFVVYERQGICSFCVFFVLRIYLLPFPTERTGGTSERASDH